MGVEGLILALKGVNGIHFEDNEGNTIFTLKDLDMADVERYTDEEGDVLRLQLHKDI